MSAGLGVQFVQTAVVLLFAPLYAGAIAKAESRVQSKRGPSVLQPYRDLAKLLRKGSAISDHLYRPDVHVERASDDPAGRSGPVLYHTRVTPAFENYLYRPIVRAVVRLSDAISPIQSGDVNRYLLYVYVTVLVAFVLGSR